MVFMDAESSFWPCLNTSTKSNEAQLIDSVKACSHLHHSGTTLAHFNKTTYLHAKFSYYLFDFQRSLLLHA
jgi:hypothetical protein